MPGEAHHRRRRLAGLVALAALVAVVPTAAIGADGPTERANALRQRDTDLAARARSAVLELYALETKAARARTELATIETRASDLRRERARVAQRLAVARASVAVAQTRLAEHLRALYAQGQVDPIAVVLGADSLDAALTGIDNLGHIAHGDETVIAEVRGARAGLTALRSRLAVRQRTLDRLVAEAAATARALAQTRASRSAYVARLASERRMTRTAIAGLEAQVQAAQQKALALEATPAPAAADQPAPDPSVAVATPEEAPGPATPDGRPMTVSATGYALPGRTATGLPVGWGIAAVDPSVIPLGTRFTVPGYGEAVAADIGGAVHGATIDLWFPTVEQAQAWGRRTVTITLH